MRLPWGLYIGVDVGKDSLEIAFHPRRKHWRENNRDFSALVGRLKILNPQLIVMESSGGYEQGLLKALQQAGLPVRLQNASHLFHYRKSLGRLVKTDHTDAQVIADYAAREHYRLSPSARPPKSVETLRALVLRREQLVALHRKERNHQKAPTYGSYAIRSCERILKLLALEIRRTEERIAQAIEADSQIQQKALRIESIPGVGQWTTAALLAFLPELGNGSRKEMAALSGLAPYEHSSGKFKGKASIQSGRSSVRLPLYMAALSAARHNSAVKALYDRMIAQGKPKKVALTACMHKLVRIANALVKQQTHWRNPASA